MSAWEEMKKVLTVGNTAGTVGYQKRLILGADIYLSIQRYLKSPETENKAFNADEELKAALINRGFVEGMGIW